jgi:hypothetical protein
MWNEVYARQNTGLLVSKSVALEPARSFLEIHSYGGVGK